ncbi:hypothetical protein AbraIFM66950_005767 [Aspergillus brasiliensis]|nr:hypothetical protein AbraIFM66950_005767 [Aspergillus brasiliensis]
MPPRFDPSAYTVGWVCAIKDEVTASRAFLDEEHEQPPRRQNDNNVYIVGAMGEHKVVIAFPGAGSYGPDAIAHTVANMVRTFRNIRIGLMVGMGGAAPSAPDLKDPLNDIRLGDVVVSEPKGNYTSHNNQGGVLQYDKGRWKDDAFEIRSHMNKPPKILLAAMKLLQSDHDIGRGKMVDYYEDIRHKSSALQSWGFRFPGRELDRLYKPDFPHGEGNDCTDCALEGLEKRLDRETDEPVVHYGIIASASAMMRSPVYRDYLRDAWGVRCFETEAAGLMNDLPCVVIKGIASYSDGHKYDHWQRYAAAMAAAYAKDLLRVMPPEEPCSTGANSQIDKDLSWKLREVESRLTKIDEMVSDNHNETMLNWLDDFPYHSKNTYRLDKRHPGTVQWLLDSEPFQSWYRAKGQTLLCLGIPGSGKTIAAATIIEYINRHKIYNNPGHALAFAFVEFDLAMQERTPNLIASLLNQLAQQDSQVMQELKALYGRHSARRTEPSTREMIDALCSMSSDRQTYVVIDALDEIEIPPAALARFLSELFRIQDSTGLNLLATSRFVPDIETLFRERDNCSFLEIQAMDDDVRRYIQGNLIYLPAFVIRDQSMADRILEVITRAASGMFLFARLCLDSLRDQVSPRRMHQALTELSNNADLQKMAYEKTMKRIESHLPNLRDLAIHALSWIFSAGRPLRMSELQHALAIQIGSHSFDKEDVVDASLIVSVCAGIISVDKESEVVQLVHHTAQGFFDNFLKEWFPDGHRVIAEACLTYLSYDWATSQDAAAMVSQYPLYCYTAQYWEYHARLGPVADEAVLRLFQSNEKVALYAQHMPLSNRCSPEMELENRKAITGLHLAAYFGLVNIAKVLVEKGGNLNAKDSWGRNVFAWAAEFGSKDFFECFHDYACHWHDVDNSGMTPLQLALSNGHTHVARYLENRHGSPGTEKVSTSEAELMCEARMGNQHSVEALLRQGVSADCRQGSRTPLVVAAIGGHLAVGKALLEYGADPNMSDWYGRTPLHHAVRRGREEFVKFLLDHGAGLNLKDNNGDTPLRRALVKRCDPVLRLLLDYKPQLDSQDKYGSTALIEAVDLCSDETFNVLLHSGPDLNIKNRKGVTALIRAALRRKVEKTRLLLASKPQIDLRDETGATALIHAARNGCYEIVDALVHSGAHLDIEDNEGQTALLWAMRNDHTSVAALLIDSGANVETTADKEGLFPLLWAVQRSCGNIVRQLILKGADVNRRDANGTTALIWSCCYSVTDCVRSLLESGAQLDMQDSLGRTALMWAAESCQNEKVDMLLESGADWRVRDLEGQTAVSYARQHSSFDECQYKRERIIQSLLRYGAVCETEVGKASQSDDGTVCEDQVLSGSE